MDLKKTYSKKIVCALVELTPNKLNKFLRMTTAIVPKKENTKGRGRPHDVFSLIDIYRLSIFSAIFQDGFNRKASEQLVSSIKSNDLQILIEYADKLGIISRYTEKVCRESFFFDIGPLAFALTEEKRKKEKVVLEDIKQKLVEKINNESSGGSVYLVFFRDGRGRVLFCLPAVEFCNALGDADDKILKIYHSTYKIRELATGFAGYGTTYVLDLGIIMGKTNYLLRSIEDDFDGWRDKIIGDDVLDPLLSY